MMIHSESIFVCRRHFHHEAHIDTNPCDWRVTVSSQQATTAGRRSSGVSHLFACQPWPGRSANSSHVGLELALQHLYTCP